MYQHLSLIYGNENEFNDEDVNRKLIELGLISRVEDKDVLEDFITRYCGFDVVNFYALVNNIDHDINNHCIIHKYCKYCRDNKRFNEERSTKPTVVDLFCGAGGLSLGFKQAGCKIVFANDIEEACIETYKFNHPEMNPDDIVLGDIGDIASVVRDHIGDVDVDIVIGGPPCQGFSNANRQRLIDDPRNKLYREFVNVVSTVRPTFFVMENVPGMLNIADQVVEDFQHIGYVVHFEVLNAVDFSVPQNRKRLIFIGNRIGIDNRDIFNQINANTMLQQPKMLSDAIEDLPQLEALRIKNATDLDSEESGKKISIHQNENINNEYLNNINQNQISAFLYNHKARYNNDRDIEIFGRLHQGDKSDDPKIADIMPYADRNHIFKDKYYKLIYNNPCKTITAHMKFDCNMYIHPTQARGLTPREAARVQSFPDDYFFKGSYTKTYMQIGNAVPPLMSRQIARVIYDTIATNRQVEFVG